MENKKKIQSILEDLTQDSVVSSINRLLDPKLILTKDILLFIARDILSLIKIREKSIYYYAQIIKAIDESIKDTNGILKSCILEGITIHSQENKQATACFRLLMYLYESNMYKYDQIINILKNVNISSQNYFILFSFFAPNIKRYHYLELLYKIDKKYEDDEIYQYLKSKNWENLSQFLNYGYKTDSLQFILRYDLIDKLQALYKENQINFDQKLSFSDFETADNPGIDLNLLEFAAYFGSYNCYKFLFTNSQISLNSAKYAIRGDSYDIIKHVFQGNIDARDCLSVASFNRRLNLFDWLIENQNDTNELFNALCNATEVNSIVEVETLLKRFNSPSFKGDIPSFGKNSTNPVEIGIKSESLECTKLILEAGISYDPLCLNLSMEKRLDDISLFLLKSGKTDPTLKDKNGKSAIEIAAESCSYEIASALVPFGHITVEILDIAQKHNNIDFLSVYMNIGDNELPVISSSSEKKSKIPFMMIFIVFSIIFIILWVYIFTTYV